MNNLLYETPETWFDRFTGYNGRKRNTTRHVCLIKETEKYVLKENKDFPIFY